jgi:hypothetical protein
MRGKVPSSQQMQEKAAGEPTPGRSFGLQQAKQRKTSLWETGGPGFYHRGGWGDCPCGMDTKKCRKYYYGTPPQTTCREEYIEVSYYYIHSIREVSNDLDSRERETLRSTLPFLSVQVLYHTGKYVVVFANKSSQSLDCTNATPLFFYQSSYPPSLYLPIWMLARSK